jgi:hypothetical protein
MRAFLALAMVLGVAGCSDADWARVSDYVGAQGVFGDDLDSHRGPASVSGELNADCREDASERALDVADQGFDGETRKAVFDATYADCVAWAARGSNVVAK